jgi:2,5-furandicarboxylate decarboxylase 1
MASDLRSFLQLASASGDEYYVKAVRPLEAQYGIGILQQQLAKRGRYPVIEATVEGNTMPAVSNLFGSYELLGMALGLSPRDILKEGKTSIMAEYLRRIGEPHPCRGVAASGAPVQEIVLTGDDVDLARLPVQHHAEGNRGPYITAGVTLIRDPESRQVNAGVYRCVVVERDLLACMIIPQHHGLHMIDRNAELGRDTEAVIFIGHHPAVLMAAGEKLPLEHGEMERAGALLGEPLEMVSATCVDVPLPARAEIAIEGIIYAADRTVDGPFSESSGYYDPGKPSVLMRVKAITMRRDAIYHNICPIHAEHMQVNLLGREANIWEHVRRVVPGLKAVHMGPEGTSVRANCYLSVAKTGADDGYRAALAALEAQPFFKYIVAVDADVDVHYEADINWALTMRLTDHASVSRHDGIGRTKAVIIDATAPLDAPFPVRATPPEKLWREITPENYL